MKASDIVRVVEDYSHSLEKWSIGSFNIISLIISVLSKELKLSKIKAEQYAYTAAPLLKKKINKKIEEYDSLGIHPPIFWLDNEDLVGTYKNKQCSLGFDWHEAKEFKDYISKSCPNKMLLVSILYILAEGFEYVEIVDGANDGGVDIITCKREKGRYGQRVLFVQSKKCSKTLNKKSLIYEDAFFKDNFIRSSGVREKYLARLGINPNTPTVDIKYTFITNGNLTPTIRDYSIRNNVHVLNSFYLSHNIIAVLKKETAINTVEKWYKEKKFLNGQNFTNKDLIELTQ